MHTVPLARRHALLALLVSAAVLVPAPDARGQDLPDDSSSSRGASLSTSPTGEVDPVLARLLEELPDSDPFFEGSSELSESDMAHLFERMDGELEVEDQGLTDEQLDALAGELGHELWISDRDLYDRLFRRFAAERIELDADQEYYVRVMMDRIRHLERPHTDELEKLFRFYVYLCASHEGMAFGGARRYEPFGRSYSAGVGHGAYVPGVLEQYETSLSMLVKLLGNTRVRTRTEQTGSYRHIFGVRLWDITREVPDTSLGYHDNPIYANRVGSFLRRFEPGNGARGIRESDLLIVWMLRVYARDFFTDRLAGMAGGQAAGGVRDPLRLADDIFTAKTTPSLAFNNEVARRLAEPISWEALGMPSDGIYNRLARFSYEHPVLTNLIPVYGACWRAANALLNAYEGRDEQGNALGAGRRSLEVGSFLFNWMMAVSDVYLVKGLAQVTVNGTRAGLQAGGRMLPQGAREALASGNAATQRLFGRMLQTTLARVPQGGVRAAGALRNVIARQLKMIRNATVAPPARLVAQAREAAQQAFRNMKDTVLRAQREIAPLLREAGEEAYHLRSTSAAVSRTTGRTYTGINANGGIRGAVREGGATVTHPRLAFIRRWLERVTGRSSLKPWNFENCAEWEAINNALQNGEKIEDLVVFTAKNVSGKPFPCCLNCRLTTLGAAVASNSEAWAGQALAGASALDLLGHGSTSLVADRDGPASE